MSTSSSENEKAASADALITDLDVKLTEHELDSIKGGETAQVKLTQDVTVNKSKTANKAADALDGYIRG